MTYHKIIKSLLLSCLLVFDNDSLADDDVTWTYTLSGDEATITGCIATCPTELFIPSTVDGYKVTSIGTNAFSNNQLTGVTIRYGVTTLGNAAFASNQLTSLTIPDTVIFIEENVNANNQLRSVTILDSVISVGSDLFAITLSSICYS